LREENFALEHEQSAGARGNCRAEGPVDLADLPNLDRQ